MALLIREEDVKQVWTIEDSIAAVEDAYRQYGLGLAGSNDLKYGYRPPPRIEVRAEGKDLPHVSPQIRALDISMAYLEETGLFFHRWGFRLGDKKGYMSYLIDAKTGELLALIKAARFASTLRTASAAAVAAKYLSRKDSNLVVGMVGTGRQGKAQLEQLLKVRDIERAYAHSGRRKDEAYAREMSQKLGIDVIACDSVEEVVRQADILATNTLATEPIVKGEWLKEGVHINAVGADDRLKVEHNFAVIKKVDKLIIDDYELALATKELRLPLEQGIISMDDIRTIGDVVAGKTPSRENASEITFFESTGMTMPYVTIYARIYEKVKNQGLGEELDQAYLDLLYD